jgi:hypothetical protein
MNWVILGVISTKVAMELASILAGVLVLSLAVAAVLAAARAGTRRQPLVARRVVLVPLVTVVPARASASRLLNAPSRASPDMTLERRCMTSGRFRG